MSFFDRARLERTASDPPRRTEKGARPEAGGALDAGQRTRMEWALGAHLGDVRVHTSSEASAEAHAESAQAVTMGQDMAFASGAWQPGTFSGDLLLAHELAHTVEQRGHGALDEPRAEAQADGAAWAAAMRLHGQAHTPAPASSLAKGGLALRRCKRPNAGEDLQKKIAGGSPLTADDARKAMDYYRGMSEADRESFFSRNNASGGVQRVIQALPPGDAAGTYRLEVRDLLTRVQRAATLQAFGGDEAVLATAQAQDTIQRAEADARAAQAAAGASTTTPPTAAEIESARQQRTASETAVRPPAAPQTWYEALPTQADRDKWDADAAAAIASVVNMANKTPSYQGLGLTVDNFVWEPNGVARYGSNVLGYGQRLPDRRRIVIGRTWVEMAKVNPAYALSIAVHESRGHWEFGEQNETYFNTVYEKARVQVPGAAPTQSKDEQLNFGYRDTEIYSLLRSAPYHTPIAAADQPALGHGADPGANVAWHIRGIKESWAPTVWPAMLRGLYVRLRMEPNITPASLQIFRDQVTAEVPEPQRSAILAP